MKKTDQITEKSAWQQAIDGGACTVDEFFDELERRIKAHFDAERNNIRKRTRTNRRVAVLSAPRA